MGQSHKSTLAIAGLLLPLAYGLPVHQGFGSRLSARQDTGANAIESWSYQTCYNDNQTATNSANAVFNGISTAEECTTQCESQGYIAAGLAKDENGNDQCSCAMAYSVNQVSSTCTTMCAGANGEVCAPSGDIQVWTKDRPQEQDKLQEQQKEQYDYVGCYSDNADNRTLPDKQLTLSGTMDVQTCKDACGYYDLKVAGLEYGSECWCGSSVPPLMLRLSDDKCQTYPCPNGEVCGGDFAVSVHATSDAPKSAPMGENGDSSGGNAVPPDVAGALATGSPSQAYPYGGEVAPSATSGVADPLASESSPPDVAGALATGSPAISPEGNSVADPSGTITVEYPDATTSPVPDSAGAPVEPEGAEGTGVEGSEGTYSDGTDASTAVDPSASGAAPDDVVGKEATDSPAGNEQPNDETSATGTVDAENPESSASPLPDTAGALVQPGDTEYTEGGNPEGNSITVEPTQAGSYEAPAASASASPPPIDPFMEVPTSTEGVNGGPISGSEEGADVSGMSGAPPSATGLPDTAGYLAESSGGPDDVAGKEATMPQVTASPTGGPGFVASTNIVTVTNVQYYGADGQTIEANDKQVLAYLATASAGSGPEPTGSAIASGASGASASGAAQPEETGAAGDDEEETEAENSKPEDEDSESEDASKPADEADAASDEAEDETTSGQSKPEDDIETEDDESADEPSTEDESSTENDKPADEDKESSSSSKSSDSSDMEKRNGDILAVAGNTCRKDDPACAYNTIIRRVEAAQPTKRNSDSSDKRKRNGDILAVAGNTCHKDDPACAYNTIIRRDEAAQPTERKLGRNPPKPTVTGMRF